MIVNVRIVVAVDDDYADDGRSQQSRLDAATIASRSCAKVLMGRLKEYGLRGSVRCEFDVSMADRFDTEVF